MKSFQISAQILVLFKEFLHHLLVVGLTRSISSRQGVTFGVRFPEVTDTMFQVFINYQAVEFLLNLTRS